LRVYAVIPAAGKGVRMGAPTPKQYAMLAGKPLLAHTLEVFERCALVHGVVLVVEAAKIEYCLREVVEACGLSKVYKVVAGGEVRRDSVHLGLKALPGDAEIVAVHDAVRPLLPLGVLEESIKGAERWGAVAPAVPLTDTIKVVDGEEVSIGTEDRKRLRAVQTPQVFKYPLLMGAMESAVSHGFMGTDETSILERAGHRVKLIEGSTLNIKVTTPEDMALVKGILELNRFDGEY
jgi:2-C-methyl-D-erythritol 4-phosphate cytidylyltransferase